MIMETVGADRGVPPSGSGTPGADCDVYDVLSIRHNDWYMNMINVSERWCYLIMRRISWTEHVTNEEVFNTTNTKSIIIDILIQRRPAFRDHLVRIGGITCDLMIGHIHGTIPWKTMDHLAEGHRYTLQRQLQRGNNYTDRLEHE